MIMCTARQRLMHDSAPYVCHKHHLTWESTSAQNGLLSLTPMHFVHLVHESTRICCWPKMVHLPVWHEALAACLPFMAECRVLIPLLLASGKVGGSELFSNRCISPKCCFTVQEDMVQNMWYTRALSTGRRALQKVLSWSALQPNVGSALRVAKECAYKGNYQRRWPQPRVHQIYRRDALNRVFFPLFIVL